jgi:two-component system, OmpR family, response regulator QseB
MVVAQSLPRPGTAVSDRQGAKRVLVVESDAEIAGQIITLLRFAGYAPDLARDGQRGLHLAMSRRYDGVILDRQLPVLDGLDVVSRLRRQAIDARILMLAARVDVADRVSCLDAGADDYLTKPFDVDELMARLRALHRRPLELAELIPLGAANLDLGARAVLMPEGTRVELSPREFDLLRRLAIRPEVVHTRERLRHAVFDDAAADSIVDTYVYYLRRKLWRGVICTVHRLGYQIGRGD